MITAKATLLPTGRIGVVTEANSHEFEEAVAMCKEVGMGRFGREPRAHWHYPATLETCSALRGVFGEGLQVLPPLAQWFVAEQGRASASAAVTAATDAELRNLPAVAPRLFGTLRADQRVGARFVADGFHGAALVADTPGLGKTLETIGGILEADLQGRFLVVCPRLSVKAVWFKELRKWTDETVFMARGTRSQREKAVAQFEASTAPRKWLIIVAEMLRMVEEPAPDDPSGKRKVFVGWSYPELFKTPWSAVIVDESHKLFGSLTVVKGNLMGRGLKKLPMTQDSRRVAVSGTPFGRGGRIQGMFGTLHWLWPDEFTSFWRWAERYFNIEEAYIGRGKTAKKITGLREGLGQEQFLAALGPRILRRTKAEVLKDLPPKQYVEVLCEMGKKQQKQYEALTVDAEVVTEGGTLLVNGVLAELTRARQLANGEVLLKNGETIAFTGESCKIDALMQKLEDRGIVDGSGDGKVIVASQFNEFLRVVQLRLEDAGVPYLILTGATGDADRDTAMETFQGEGGPRVFLLNSKAGGVSITLDAADEVHCLDEMWNPEDNEQLEDRAHRASRIHQVTIYYYRTEGTIDTAIAEDVEGKRFEQFKVLDARRGMEYLRSMVQFRPTKEN